MTRKLPINSERILLVMALSFAGLVGAAPNLAVFFAALLGLVLFSALLSFRMGLVQPREQLARKIEVEYRERLDELVGYATQQANKDRPVNARTAYEDMHNALVCERDGLSPLDRTMKPMRLQGRDP